MILPSACLFLLVLLTITKKHIFIVEIFFSPLPALSVQVFPPNEKIESINDQYWTLRAEEVGISFCMWG